MHQIVFKWFRLWADVRCIGMFITIIRTSTAAAQEACELPSSLLNGNNNSNGAQRAPPRSALLNADLEYSSFLHDVRGTILNVCHQTGRFQRFQMRPRTDSIQLRSDCDVPVVQSHVAKTRGDQGTVLKRVNQSIANSILNQYRRHTWTVNPNLVCSRPILLRDRMRGLDIL